MMQNEPKSKNGPINSSNQTPFDSLSEERKKEIAQKARQLLANELLSNATSANSIIRSCTENEGVSRRNILQSAAITGLGYLVTKNVWKRMFKEQKDEQLMHSVQDIKVNDAKQEETKEAIQSERTIFQAACQIGWDSFLMKIGEICTIMACHSAGIRVGNAGLLSLKSPQAHEIDKLVEQIDEKGPDLAKEIFNKICIKGPFNEEMVFRVIPSVLLRDNKRHWEIGMPSAVLFAMIHNITDHNKPVNSIRLTENKVFSLDWIPLPQFLTGVFYWYLAREFGSLTPIPMHILHNFLPASQIGGGMLIAHKKLDQFKNELASSEINLGAYNMPAGLKSGDS